MTETITAAAIKYGDLVMFTERPGRHHHVFWELDKLGVPRIETHGVQGFVTSTGRFVEREEARVIAEDSGQLIAGDQAANGTPCVRQHSQLFSEDVW